LEVEKRIKDGENSILHLISYSCNMPEDKKPLTDQSNNPLHGVKLADMLELLERELGWEEMGRQIDIRCFNNDPSIKSSLKFLRRTPWARDKVEYLYLKTIGKW